MYVYLVLERGFLRTFGQHSKSFTKHCHVENNYPLSICKKVLFYRPRKKHPVYWDSYWKPSSAICDMKINNSSKRFLKERKIEEELQENFPLAAIFVYSLARGKKTEH